MANLSTLFIACFLLANMLANAAEPKEFQRKEKLMGKAFQIVIVHSDSVFANKALDAAVQEIRRTESLISSWQADSECSEINQNAGNTAVEISPEFFQFIQRCKVFSQISAGAFDISIQPLLTVWNKALKQKQIPDSISIAKSLELVNFENIICDSSKQTVFLKKEGMAISFGAVGKGLAAENAKIVLQKMGIENALINASGDIAAWGKQSNGKAWGINVQHPRDEGKVMAWLEIKNQAIVSSGDYEAFQIIDGKRYSHILDPRSGFPSGEIYSCTVISYNAELADAMATAIFVLGIEKGLQLAEQIKDLEVLLFAADNEIYKSSGLDIKWEKH